LGIHVLSRNIIFVDLALAQISALGATVAFLLGYYPQSIAAYGYSLAFTIGGAVILSFSRSWTGRVSQETFIGVVYVVSAAAAFLLVDRSPQGAEHIKQMLIGSILTATETDLLKVALLYSAVGLFHWFVRKRFLLISFQPERAEAAGLRLWLWDFLFYVSFGVVVTSSVAIAGVLLVFCFLIIPAAIGALYSDRILPKLLIGWAIGVLASSAGLGLSFAANLPIGATIVCVFGGMLALAALLKPLLFNPNKLQILRQGGSFVITSLLTIAFLSGAWLTFRPKADQPLLDWLETSYPPLRQAFLTPEEQDDLQQAGSGFDRWQSEIQRLDQMERQSRWQGEVLSDRELRRISSYTMSFQEMQNGEKFVQRELRNAARQRQRWVFGIPLMLLSIAGFLAIQRSPIQPDKPLPDQPIEANL
jgi:zinc/manganese transport system permease protein